MGADANEAERLAALRSYRILDTAPEPSFDRLTALAARACDAPMAIVTIVDESRQWFKSSVGIELSETDRSISFCAHTIRSSEPFVVTDASSDERFADNPLVTGGPGIRAYHGVPLIDDDGHALGALAVLDCVPRQLDEVQADVLELLAAQAMTELEQHRRRVRLSDAERELERMEGELAESARRYDELYRTNTEPMIIFDVETLDFLDVNDAMVARYGYTREQLADMTIADIRPPEDVERLHEVLHQSAAAPYHHVAPVRHRRADGTVFPVDIAMHQLTYEGRPARLARVRDITEVELAERRLAEAAELLVERLTSIVDVWRNLSDGAPTLDELYDAIPGLAMDVLGADGAALFLADGDDLVPRAFTGYLTMAPRLPIVGTLAGWSYLNGQATRSDDYVVDPRVENLVPRPDGSRAIVIAPVEGFHGPVGVIVLLDRRAGRFDEADERSLDLLARALGAIVRRVGAEDARRQSEERLGLVVQATADAIYDWDLQEGSVWWDPEIEELFGLSADELMAVPSTWVEHIHPDDLDRVVEEMTRFIRDPRRTTSTRTYRIRRGDGTYAHVRDRSTIIRRDDGRGVRVVGGMSDVTDQVEAEAWALQSQRLEAVGQLTGGIAHDFNNLLTVILGNAEQLITDLEDRPDLQDFAEMTRSAALRGAELSHRLLAFARRQALEPAAVDPNRLLSHLDGLLRRTLPEDVELELVRGAGAWPAFVDPGQLENALLNLCLNSRDAMPDGGRITIETGNARIDQRYADEHTEVEPGQYVMIAVSDTGIGIPPDIVGRVVEPFFSTKGQGVGSGLGLSMVHGFVKQTDGHIKIYSEPGEGTTVRLYLPRAARAPDDVADERQVQPVLRGTERILLVEDDALVRRLAARHLTGLGYDVVTAASGPEALELLRRERRVDLLFTDVVMPGGMGGRELAAVAVELQPDLAVLYTSGYTENAIVHHGRLDPGVELLGKPYRPVELARKVRSVLDDRGAAAERDG
ncbi:MAG: PAS domain S-box protein [Ilumatobacteraceae bacterium]